MTNSIEKIEFESSKGDKIEIVFSQELLDEMEKSRIRVENTLAFLEEERRITPEILHEPLDASWLVTLPELTRKAILEGRKNNKSVYGWQ